jgi:two-component system, chemotaxis family, protein-glutamate methylesterase/glutaminase
MAVAEEPLREPARSAAELPTPDAPIELVVAGASAGGVEALRALVAALPASFGASLLVVLHISEAGTSVLPEILARAGALPVATALHGEPLQRGRVYVAPPGRHLLVSSGAIHLTHGPRENGHRPAIDPLFRTAAAAYGPRVAGVILSGMLDDGTSGLHHVARQGGIAIVQDPDEAMYKGMPGSAAARVAVDAVLPLSEIAPALVRVAGRATDDLKGDPVPNDSPSVPVLRPHDGKSTRFTCPDCGGVLFEYDDGPVDRFACSVGHAYSLESLVDGQANQLEAALWAAVRVLEDRVVLLRRMERYSREAANDRSAAQFEARASELIARAELIRSAVERTGELPLASTADAVDRT